MPTNSDNHEMLAECCPHCYRPLKRVVETGFTFCVADNFVCGYELNKHALKPLSPNEAKKQLLADSKRELDHQIDRIFSAIKQRYGDDSAISTVKEALATRLTEMESNDDDTNSIH